jgi:hypothetical protein
MPNHVYHTLTLSDESQEPIVLEAIKLNGGLAQYFKPMPDEMRDTASPTFVVDDEQKVDAHHITQQRHDELVDKYGYDNWYDWAVNNWNTKWGTYSHEYDSGLMQLTFSTAWSPMGEDIMKMMSDKFKGSLLHLVEESGEFDKEFTL